MISFEQSVTCTPVAEHLTEELLLPVVTTRVGGGRDSNPDFPLVQRTLFN